MKSSTSTKYFFNWEEILYKAKDYDIALKVLEAVVYNSIPRNKKIYKLLTKLNKERINWIEDRDYVLKGPFTTTEKIVYLNLKSKLNPSLEDNRLPFYLVPKNYPIDALRQNGLIKVDDENECLILKY